MEVVIGTEFPLYTPWRGGRKFLPWLSMSVGMGGREISPCIPVERRQRKSWNSSAKVDNGS